MLVARHDNLEPDWNLLVRLTRRVYPVSSELDGERFFTRIDGRRAGTPLLLVVGSTLLVTVTALVVLTGFARIVLVAGAGALVLELAWIRRVLRRLASAASSPGAASE